MSETLVIVDTPRIQSYIFSSNRLRENIGASHLVKLATGDWPLECVHENFTHHNVFKDANTYFFDDSRKFEDQTVQVEVLYIGGGSFVALFREKQLAKDFTTALSRKVLIEAPGLQIRVIHHGVDFSQKNLSKSFQAALHEHDFKNTAYLRSAPLLGLGVTVAGDSMGLPAVGTIEVGDDTAIVSAEVYSKANRQFIDETNDKLHQQLGLSDDYKYPLDFDDMGRSKGEHSYIAVVHADGNQVGQIVMRLGDYFADLDGNFEVINRQYINTIRNFAERLRVATEAAVKATQNELIAWLKGEGDQSSEPAKHLLKEVRHRWRQEYRKREHAHQELHRYQQIPFRPIVVGGDDVTFVCDGRLGVSLAQVYLQAFVEMTSEAKVLETIPDDVRNELQLNDTLTAAAGIAIVKSHYPFSRAYQLADDLCSEAKKLSRQTLCLDWHFATTGLFGDLDAIRDREYTVDDVGLQLRPVALESDTLQSWDTIEKSIKAFRANDENNRPKWPRSKAKNLFSMLRQKDGAEHFQRTYRVELPRLESVNSEPENGYREVSLNERRAYFDALEMLDWYIDVVGETTHG